MARNIIELKSIKFRRPNGPGLNAEATVVVGLSTGIEPGGGTGDYSEFVTVIRAGGANSINDIRREAASRIHAHIKALSAHSISEIEAQIDAAASYDSTLG